MCNKNSYDNAVTQCHVDGAQRAWGTCVFFVIVFLFIGVRAFFCQGGGEPFAQKILTNCPNFTKQSKGNECHTMH